MISILPDFSLEIPVGALPQPVFIPVTPRSSTPFPADVGEVVPGTAFDVGPAGVLLAVPARIFMRVPRSLLDVGAGEDLRLVLALERIDGSVSTHPGSYDTTNGLLSAELGELGPVAAVVVEPVP